LKLKSDGLLSNFASKFNLRRYTAVQRRASIAFLKKKDVVIQAWLARLGV
jgi:hypothetical protein